MLWPPAFAAPTQPSARAPASAPAQVQPQPYFQPGQQAQHQEVPDDSGWAEVPSRKVKPAPTAALAVPQPAALTRASSGAGGSAGSSPAGSAGKGGGWGSVGGGKAGGGGGSRKAKGVGYEDDKARWVDGAADESCLGVPAESGCNLLGSMQHLAGTPFRASPLDASALPRPFPLACLPQEWLVKDTRNRTSGPFTGFELLDMLLNDTLAESSQVRVHALYPPGGRPI